jgi:hypothetical protein
MSNAPPRETVPEYAGSEGECPACGGPLFAWAEAHAFDARRDEEYVLDRCERCRTAVSRSSPAHPASGPRPRDAADAEVADLLGDPAGGELRCPNRNSFQASIGEGDWAALELPERPLQLTPMGLEAVLSRRGLGVKAVRYTVFGRNQRWMWQTLLNALTFRPNFAREALAGRLRPGGAFGTFKFVIDATVSVLAAPLVALVSIPLETVAAIARRGGEMRVTVGPAEAAQASSTAIAASSSGESS